MNDNVLERMKRAVEGLDNNELRQKYGDELESVDASHEMLARVYYDVLVGATIGSIILLSSLLLIDCLIYLDSLIYGLTINIWSALFILFPSLRGRYEIAAISENIDEAILRRMEVRRGSYTLVGFALLAFGFILQIISHQSIEGQLLTIDVATGLLPSWSALVFIGMSFWITLGYYDA